MATLNQEGHPATFWSQKLNASEQHNSPVEKKVAAIVEGLREWHYYLINFYADN